MARCHECNQPTKYFFIDGEGNEAGFCEDCEQLMGVRGEDGFKTITDSNGKKWTMDD